MIHGIQLALECAQNRPRSQGLVLLQPHCAQGSAPGRHRPFRPGKKEGAVLLARQTAALELATHAGNSTELSQNSTKAQDCLVLGPVLGKDMQVAVGSCSAQSHNGWLSTSSPRDAARPSESKNKLPLLSQSSRPSPQSPLVVPRGGDLANGKRSAFCLRSFHHYTEVAPKIQNRPFKHHSGLAFKTGFLNHV